MKKIITLCSVILALAFIVTAFTACGDKPQNDDKTTTGVASNESGFAVELQGSQAIIKKDGKEFQVLKYPSKIGVTFNFNYAVNNNAFIDMNFDGSPDFYIAASFENDVVNYYCWLYNQTTNKFDYSVALSALKNISVDADNHRVLSSIMVEGEKHIFSYKWVDAELILDTDYNESEGGIPEDVTNVANDNAIGVEKTTVANTDKVEKTSDAANKEETTKKNSDENKTTTQKKPANTTTTAPNKNNPIIIETGNPNEGWY